MTGQSEPRLSLRSETAADRSAIRDLLLRVFPGPDEADLVEQLRGDNALVNALVAEAADHKLHGYVAFSRVLVDNGDQVEPAAAPAPLAVAPDEQGRGIGYALVRTGLTALAARGGRLVFVLGDPAYYNRFGFSAAAANAFASRYAGPNFLALRLLAGGPEAGRLCYPAAFDQLS
ncbi:MAG: N-acetyltransferase [Xanthobacteraceae bacterium]